jgi:hypothetical protein
MQQQSLTVAAAPVIAHVVHATSSFTAPASIVVLQQTSSQHLQPIRRLHAF